MNVFNETFYRDSNFTSPEFIPTRAVNKKESLV